MKTLKYRILPFDKKHDKKGFSCGIEALDRYIMQQAGQDKRCSVTATYILSEKNHDAILGYYTLSATSILLTDLPEKTIKKLPRYPTIPATLLGRLAVDNKYQGNRLGELLLVDALKRSLDISKRVASFSLVVNAKTENAIEFYQRYGFIQFPSHKARLFLPMATIAQAFLENVIK
ncbi:MAG: GNAT family N-acetyltransferase [Gammaproteobacteria bacterium]|jgi:predicted GNAT family N-acyltransferase